MGKTTRLQQVRRQLDDLVETRQKGVWTDSDQTLYGELCVEEERILSTPDPVTSVAATRFGLRASWI